MQKEDLRYMKQLLSDLEDLKGFITTQRCPCCEHLYLHGYICGEEIKIMKDRG